MGDSILRRRTGGFAAIFAIAASSLVAGTSIAVHAVSTIALSPAVPYFDPQNLGGPTYVDPTGRYLVTNSLVPSVGPSLRRIHLSTGSIDNIAFADSRPNVPLPGIAPESVNGLSAGGNFALFQYGFSGLDDQEPADPSAERTKLPLKMPILTVGGEPGDNYGLDITVRHYPPGTSKWSRIDHRMFSWSP